MSKLAHLINGSEGHWVWNRWICQSSSNGRWFNRLGFFSDVVWNGRFSITMDVQYPFSSLIIFNGVRCPRKEEFTRRKTRRLKSVPNLILWRWFYLSIYLLLFSSRFIVDVQCWIPSFSNGVKSYANCNQLKLKSIENELKWTWNRILLLSFYYYFRFERFIFNMEVSIASYLNSRTVTRCVNWSIWTDRFYRRVRLFFETFQKRLEREFSAANPSTRRISDVAFVSKFNVVDERQRGREGPA